MTPRDSEGPRPDSPGPTPRLDAVERLRRQLEATTARAAKRTPRAPRSPSPDSGHDLFGRDSTDPYTSSTGWNYGPSGGSSGFASHQPVPEDNSADYQRSTWRTTDTATTQDDRPASPHRDVSDDSPTESSDSPTARTRPARNLEPASHPAGDPATDVDFDPNPSRPHHRPPTGRRRAPGQWREEAPTAPGDGGTEPPLSSDVDRALLPDSGNHPDPTAPAGYPAITPISPTATREEKLRTARAALSEATAGSADAACMPPQRGSEYGDREDAVFPDHGAGVAASRESVAGHPDVVPISPTASREEKLRAARAALVEATAAAKASGGTQDSKTRSRRKTRDSVAATRESVEFGDAEGGVTPGANRRSRPTDRTTDLRHGSDDSDSAARELSARRSSRRGNVHSPVAGDYSDEDRASVREGVESWDEDGARRSRGRSYGGGGRKYGGDRRAFDENADAAGDSGERRGRRGGRRGRGGSGEESPQPGGPVGGGTEAQAKEVCLRMLADRARSRAEMADRLADKGFAAAVAKRALDRLAEVGLVDDAAFAQQWVHSRHTYSGKGKKVLAEELRRKGIAPEDAEPALEAITPEAETARAAELARRKLITLSPDLERDKVISRLVSMLARRGYSPGTAYAVATAELAAAAERRRNPDHDSDLPSLLSGRSPRAATRHGSTTDGPPADASPAADLTPSSTRSPSNRGVKRREFASDDTDSAADLVRAKLRTLSPNLDRETATRRLVGLLARRGFNAGIAYRVVSAELEAAAALQAAESSDHPESTPEVPRSSLARRTSRASDRDIDQAAHANRPKHLDAGVDAEDDPATSEDDEFARAAELVRAKLRTLPPNLDRAKAMNRLVGLLARRGFSQSTAYSVVKTELANMY